jgi:hypothetical protein
MGLKHYRGTVNTVETAALDHRVITITCLDCSRETNRWAYRINQQGAPWGALPLNKPVKGFYCQCCQRGVLVVLKTDGPWY